MFECSDNTDDSAISDCKLVSDGTDCKHNIAIITLTEVITKFCKRETDNTDDSDSNIICECSANTADSESSGNCLLT